MAQKEWRKKNKNFNWNMIPAAIVFFSSNERMNEWTKNYNAKRLCVIFVIRF